MNKIINILSPILPKNFDKNEIYVIIISILATWITLYLHKKYKSLLTTEFIGIFLINLLFSILGEAFMAEPPLDFYDTADKPYAEITDLVLQIFVYPPTILIAVQYYAKYNPNRYFYIILYSLVLTFLEFISVEIFNLFQYKKWNLLYSFLFYLLVMALNIIFYNKIHSVIKKNIEQKG